MTPNLFVLQGLTALMYAVINDHAKVVNELILAKADPSLKSKVSTLARRGRPSLKFQQVMSHLRQ